MDTPIWHGGEDLAIIKFPLGFLFIRQVHVKLAG